MIKSKKKLIKIKSIYVSVFNQIHKIRRAVSPAHYTLRCAENQDHNRKYNQRHIRNLFTLCLCHYF